MIPLSLVTDTMLEAMKKAALLIPPDVERFLRRAMEEEPEPLAREHVAVTLENARLAAGGEGLICADTGFPLYFVTAGPDTEVEGGLGSLWKAARRAVEEATRQNYLRPTMVDPLSRANPGNNLGALIPAVELSFRDRGPELEIVAAPKGGGSEIFGTFYRMMYPADGEVGIVKFVCDCVLDGCYAGKVCPPAIVGVGIGGTADLCMKIAKKAAVLRPVGVHHPDPRVARLEQRLMDAFKKTGVGPMGAAGMNAVMAVNIETEVTHTAALPVAVNAQCCIGRRWKAVIHPDCRAEFTGDFHEQPHR